MTLGNRPPTWEPEPPPPDLASDLEGQVLAVLAEGSTTMRVLRARLGIRRPRHFPRLDEAVDRLIRVGLVGVSHDPVVKVTGFRLTPAGRAQVARSMGR